MRAEYSNPARNGSGKTPTPVTPEPDSRLARYGVAVAASAAAWLLSLLLASLVDPSDLPLFVGAVMLSAWYGGLGPGLLATGLGALAGVIALVPTNWDLPALSPMAIAPVAVVVAESLIITSLSAGLRAARRRAERLVVLEHAARAEAERSAQRLRDLQRVTDIALANLKLDDLLRELIARVREVLDADTVVILLLTEDGREIAVRAALGLEEEVAEGIRIPVGQGIAGRIAAQSGPLVFDDLDHQDIASPILRRKGLKSLLGVPLSIAGRPIGVIHVGTLSARRFTSEDQSLLQLVADRIATAIDRARLYEAVETAEHRFRLLADGVPDYATYMVDPGGRIMSWNGGAERLKGYSEAEALGQPLARFYTEEDQRRGAPARTLEIAAREGRFEGEAWRVRRDGSRFWADVVVTALRDGDGRLVGYAVVTHDLTERNRSAEVRARLLDQLIAAQEDEQRRIARELHDEMGQSLTSLLVGLRALEEASPDAAARRQASDLRNVALRVLDEVRRLARGLRPSALDELGLVAALEFQAAELGQAHGLTVDVQTRGLEGERLPPHVETTLYRIIQEALTNVVKHAGARAVDVVVHRQGGSAQAIVTDDGCGFDVDTALRAPGAWTHLGLHGMRERAGLLDGAVTIESAPGEGTTIYVRIPLPVESPSPA
jgi:PAS domain S-box-containing protein